jgi:hypothetical protein
MRVSTKTHKGLAEAGTSDGSYASSSDRIRFLNLQNFSEGFIVSEWGSLGQRSLRALLTRVRRPLN